MNFPMHKSSAYTFVLFAFLGSLLITGCEGPAGATGQPDNANVILSQTSKSIRLNLG